MLRTKDCLFCTHPRFLQYSRTSMSISLSCIAESDCGDRRSQRHATCRCRDCTGRLSHVLHVCTDQVRHRTKLSRSRHLCRTTFQSCFSAHVFITLRLSPGLCICTVSAVLPRQTGLAGPKGISCVAMALHYCLKCFFVEAFCTTPICICTIAVR